MNEEITIVSKELRELNEALTDGQGIPNGEVWVATGSLRTYTVACRNTAFIRILRGYTTTKALHKVAIWEARGREALDKSIQKAWKQAISAN